MRWITRGAVRAACAAACALPIMAAWAQAVTPAVPAAAPPRAVPAIRGLPLARIEPAWCAAEELRSLQAPLEGKPARLQTAVLGRYRRCTGEQGLFALVMEPRPDRARFRYLLELPEPGDAAPGGLEFDAARRELVVRWCAPPCERQSRIAWDAKAGRYEVQ